ncbi:MAG: threonine synthase [Gammaproteobacteria bacterium]
MLFASTRGSAPPLGLAGALVQGLAPDGGLYVPTTWPVFSPTDFDGATTLPEVAERLLAPFAAGGVLASEMPAIVREAFDFPAPVVELVGAATEERLSVLELFHGPTAAFKDFGARFLAASMARLRGGSAGGDDRPLHILVATSGDTGGAVAAAFHGRPGFRVSVLFPKGLVSPTQERQLTCWGGNVQSYAVAGTFDDCQRMVKEAFLDPGLATRHALSSANSINLGRLLPQAVYYAATGLAHRRATGESSSFIIPSGNLGNAAACIWARRMGLPIGDVIFAHNANRTVPDLLESGELRPRSSLATIASAMDVGNPSNLERLRQMHPTMDSLRGAVRALSVDDDAIRARIVADHARFGQIWCPHTAVAAEAWARLTAQERRAADWCLVATASPAKFPEVVEPLLGLKVPVPPALAALFDRPTNVQPLAASFTALRDAIEADA